MDRTELVLAIHPAHAESILSGRKGSELRTRFPKVERGAVVYLYSTSPTSAVVGGFVVGDVVEASPRSLWHRFGSDLGITKAEFKILSRSTSG